MKFAPIIANIWNLASGQAEKSDGHAAKNSSIRGDSPGFADFRTVSPYEGNEILAQLISKFPELTLQFWIVKVASTSLGEAGGDAVTVSMGVGYPREILFFAVIFCVAVFVQILAQKFHPAIYWITIIATTMVGTTLADFADRSLGLGTMVPYRSARFGLQRLMPFIGSRLCFFKHWARRLPSEINLLRWHTIGVQY